MVELSSAVIGGIAVALLGGIGWLVKRVVSGEKAREGAALYSDYASIAGIMKTHGLVVEDVQAVATWIKEKDKQKKALNIAESRINPEAALMGPTSSYWTQSAMNTRARAAAQLADAQLDAALAELLGLLSSEEDELLRASQNAWNNYREAQSELEAEQVRGGSLEPLIRNTELETITLKRIAEITAIADRRKQEIDL